MQFIVPRAWNTLHQKKSKWCYYFTYKERISAALQICFWIKPKKKSAKDWLEKSIWTQLLWIKTLSSRLTSNAIAQNFVDRNMLIRTRGTRFARWKICILITVARWVTFGKTKPTITDYIMLSKGLNSSFIEDYGNCFWTGTGISTNHDIFLWQTAFCEHTIGLN